MTSKINKTYLGFFGIQENSVLSSVLHHRKWLTLNSRMTEPYPCGAKFFLQRSQAAFLSQHTAITSGGKKAAKSNIVYVVTFLNQALPGPTR